MIDTHVDGDPAACTAAGADLTTLASKFTDFATTLKGHAAGASAEWDGDAADGFATRITDAVGDIDQAAAKTRAAGTAVTTFAGELAAVRSTMASARERATAGGLQVSGETIHEPTAPTPDPNTPDTPEAQQQAQQAQQAAQARQTLYTTLRTEVEAARTKEDSAHSTVVSAVEEVTARGLLGSILEKLGFLPPTGADGVETALWAGGLAGFLVGGASAWMLKVRYGRFAPRVGNRFVPFKNAPAWKNAWRQGFDKNWAAKPYMASSSAPWKTASKWANRAGPVLTGGLSAWDQWQADADDPSIDTTERVARAGTVGVSSGLGAWGGAVAGAQIGGMVGSFGGPVGTVIGGALGGAIGGFAGSEAGKWVGEQVMGPVGDAADWVGDKAGDLAEGVGDVASDVGDALTFWD